MLTVEKKKENHITICSNRTVRIEIKVINKKLIAYIYKGIKERPNQIPLVEYVFGRINDTSSCKWFH